MIDPFADIPTTFELEEEWGRTPWNDPYYQRGSI